MIVDLFIFILGVLIINTSFLAIPFLSPRIDQMEIMSYQIFTNMMFILFLILPTGLNKFK
jgi:uncharacterized membrane protein YozB (DUF420 family)